MGGSYRGIENRYSVVGQLENAGFLLGAPDCEVHEDDSGRKYPNAVISASSC